MRDLGSGDRVIHRVTVERPYREQSLLPDIAWEELPDGHMHIITYEVHHAKDRFVDRGKLTYEGTRNSSPEIGVSKLRRGPQIGCEISQKESGASIFYDWDLELLE